MVLMAAVTIIMKLNTGMILSLSLIIMMLCAVKAEYELEISIHSFTLLRAQCAICRHQSWTLQVTETYNERCDGPYSSTCDVYSTFCQRQLGTATADSFEEECPDPITTGVLSYMFPSRVNLDSYPVLFSGVRWEGSQFFVQVKDRDPNPDDLIDTLTVDVDIPVGASISRTTYTGRFNNVRFELSFKVVCAENYYGPDCTRFCDDDECSCDPGYTGEFCETNINDCEGVNCSGHGLCEDGINSFTCQCEFGYTGKFCETVISGCEDISCTNGQCVSVHVLNTNIICECDPGYTGVLCEVNIDDCFGVNCSGNGHCVDGFNNYTCECDLGYTGEFCETNINDCEGVNCSGQGQCEDELNHHTCKCFEGYAGESCEININTCIDDHCSGNRICVLNDAGNLSCVCNSGYTGKNCESEIVDSNCTDDHDCNGNGICINSMSCDCFHGYTGTTCEIQMIVDDICLNVDCSGNGKCITTEDLEKGYVCLCNGSHFGENCEQAAAPTIQSQSQSTTRSNIEFIVGGALGGVIFILLAIIIILVFLLAIQSTKNKGESHGMKHRRLNDLQLSLPTVTPMLGDNPVYGAPLNNPVSSDYYEVGPTESNELGMSYSASCDLTVASVTSSSRTAVSSHQYEEL